MVMKATNDTTGVEADDTSADPRRVMPPRSISRLLGLVEQMAQRADGMSLTEISSELEAPKSSLLNLLRPLVDQDFLTHKISRYYLGPRMFQMASAIIARSRHAEMVRHHMMLLHEWTNETIIYVTLDRQRDRIVFGNVVESDRTIRYSVSAGVARALYSSAAGRLLLAFQTEDWREAYLARTRLEPLTPQTITDVGELRRELQKVKTSGVCFTLGEAVEDAAGVAAPIFDPNGSVSGALLIGLPANRGQERRLELEAMVSRAARRLSRALGYQYPPSYTASAAVRDLTSEMSAAVSERNP
ncbi:IclR family transcriptional regulator protein (plasmid) [Rhizobium gallicum]|uniref:IclR family transcriptional regulator protein n=1 Tax=Rhizobium gallicum TaxID=56730 RepID=A0A1L5NS78_9HYPH|nr:IclR family transcriptional regulator [Rhizobium gallicum]APO70699.1 IclR family transcriptional regulator protein [Rhizobium gallicum]